ncbi:MAG: cupin domain-containing protein [Actinomycetota bacterium]
MVLVLVGLAGAGALLIGTAVATPSSGVVAETARGELAQPLRVFTRFDNGAKVRIKTKGAIEVITQRIVAEPGATFGWHSHPGENVNVVLQGTLTLYHDEHCTEGIDYGPGTSFPTSPDEIHLARNLGTDQLVFFATYFAPNTTPPLPVRIDQPLPAPGCPQ